MSSLIYDVENTDNILDYDMVKRTWEMQADGLKCIDCTGEEASIGSKVKQSKSFHNGRVHITDEGVYINGSEGKESKSFHNGRVHITDEGVYINGSDGTSLTIDSNGVSIHEKGKTKIIKKGTVEIKSDAKNKEW